MKRLSAFLATLIIACARQGDPTPTAVTARAVPFHVSNTDHPFTMRAALTGRVDVYPNALAVVVYPDTVIDRTREVDRGAHRAEVRAALASGDRSGRWRLDYQSAWQPIAELQSISHRNERDSVRFVIRGVRPSNLATRWLVFEFSSIMTDQRTHQRIRVSNFLHTPAEIFGH